MRYEAPSVTELGSLEELTQGNPALNAGNDFLFVGAAGSEVVGVGETDAFAAIS